MASLIRPINLITFFQLVSLISSSGTIRKETFVSIVSNVSKVFYFNSESRSYNDHQINCWNQGRQLADIHGSEQMAFVQSNAKSDLWFGSECINGHYYRSDGTLVEKISSVDENDCKKCVYISNGRQIDSRQSAGVSVADCSDTKGSVCTEIDSHSDQVAFLRQVIDQKIRLDRHLYEIREKSKRLQMELETETDQHAKSMEKMIKKEIFTELSSKNVLNEILAEIRVKIWISITLSFLALFSVILASVIYLSKKYFFNLKTNETNETPNQVPLMRR